MTDKEFIDCVKEEMAELASKGVNNVGDQFAVWFATKILGEAEGEAIEQFHIGGPKDNKVDLGILNEDHSSTIIAQCKYSSTPEKSTFSVDLPEEAKNAVDRLRTSPDIGSDKRKAFAQKFNGSEKPVRVLAVGFGTFSEDAYKYAKTNKIEIYSFDKLKKRYVYNDAMEGFKSPDVIELQIDSTNSIKQDVSDLGLRQWIFLHKAREIYTLVKKYGDGIFQSNLRFRLMDSAKSGIGRDIYNTVIGDDSKAFSILNNGLTIVASRVEPKNGNLSILSPQIVNGCQSSWAIYDAIEHLLASGKDIEEIETTVLVKLVETSEDELTARITQSTNRQNTIDDRDVHSKDDVQIEIASEFKSNDPPIFYDHRAGHWESITRDNQTHIYKISGKKYRKISNTLAGQIYLALLDKPYYSKQFKQKIFKDSDYYRTIFRTDLSKTDRFKNETLSVDPKTVLLSSGTSNFVNDILFGYAIYVLSDAIKERYRKKTNSYDQENMTDQESAAYNRLKNQYFIVTWHFLLISVLNNIVFSWKKHGKDIDHVREKLLGKDWNKYFGNHLNEEFNPCENKEYSLILDDNNPTNTFPLFWKWTEKIIEKLTDKIELVKDKPEFTFRWYIDQRQETFTELKEWINLEFSKGPKKWAEMFPLE